MPRLHNLRIDVTTDGAGAAQEDGETSIYGLLEAIEWINTDFAVGVDATISMQNTASGNPQTLLTITNGDADKIYYPRVLVQSEAGADLTGTSGGDRTKPLINGKPRLVIAQGGATKKGAIIIHYWN